MRCMESRPPPPPFSCGLMAGLCAAAEFRYKWCKLSAQAAGGLHSYRYMEHMEVMSHSSCSHRTQPIAALQGGQPREHFLWQRRGIGDAQLSYQAGSLYRSVYKPVNFVHFPGIPALEMPILGILFVLAP